jgi:predicted nucleotidyltransferase
MSTLNLGERLRKLREDKQMPLRKVAAMIDMDVAILSKIERGKRRLTKEVVQKLAKMYSYDVEELMVLYLSEKVIAEIGDDDLAIKALHAAEDQVAYLSFIKIDKIDLLNQLKNGIRKFPQIEKAWIYGSFARGDDGPKSDIDIAIQTKGTFTYFDLAEVQHELETSLKRNVDVGFIDSFKPYIFEHIQADLKLIYER